MALASGLSLQPTQYSCGRAGSQGQEGVRADRASPLGLLSYNGEIRCSISLGPRPRGASRSLTSIKHLPFFSPARPLDQSPGGLYLPLPHSQRVSECPFICGAPANFDQNGTRKVSKRNPIHLNGFQQNLDLGLLIVV